MNIERTKKNYPAIWVGGGSATNTCQCRFVLDSGLRLKPAIFIRRGGHLSNGDQALVGLKEGDIIVDMSGRRNAVSLGGYSAGDLFVEAYRIVSFKDNEAETKPFDLEFENIPDSVLAGLRTYHNREGSYFVCGELKPD
jgi:hypothetical protein